MRNTFFTNDSTKTLYIRQYNDFCINNDIKFFVQITVQK